MKYKDEKEKLLKAINMIEMEDWDGNYLNTLVNDVLHIKNVIENDFYTVVVLGEFKRGKSTFINALLGTELLPSNITPTTATINALMYSEEQIAEVVFKDGTTKKGVSTLEYLEGFSAESSVDTSSINYIKVGYPSELLRNHVILVDTPGVSDINKQRVQVTYDFIPKADVVIFLLDATAPMKRTEKEFIEEHLLNIGIEKVIFIANRFDELEEEEEEEEEVLASIKKRLNATLKQIGMDEIQVIPFSAYQALQGVIKKDEHLITESKLPLVQDKIQSVIYDGTSPENKIKNYKRKLCLAIEALGRQTEQELKIIAANTEELEEIIGKMNAFAQNEANRNNKLAEYAEIQKKDMLAIIRKSLQYFQSQLKQEVIESVDCYQGTEFKSYIEKQIVSLVQKRILHWISTYSVAMNQMLVKLNKELAAGLARHFNTSVNTSSHVSMEFNPTPVKITIEADDISNVTLKAGLITGSATGLLMLAGGSLFVPLIGLAGMPYLQKTMLNQKLKEAKERIIPDLSNLINQTFNSLYKEIEKKIDTSIEQILSLNEQQFFEIFNTYVKKIEKEIQYKKSIQDTLEDQWVDLSNKNDLLTTLLMELRG